ncbi:PAS domain-containing protein, partial [Brevundimonas sp.]|uniref:PAS domain-containing protein n=1 Tax=Brevundimonas sp. TaxID=1871086 RepID=UPI002FC94749
MFLEGQVNWMWVWAAVAAFGWIVALVAIVSALRRGAQHGSASDQLDLIQRMAEDSQKRLFETLNAIPVALVETDKQGKFVFANRAAHQLLGRKDAELIGLRFHSATWGITFPDGRPVPPDLLPSARALRGQTVRGFQHLLANPAARRKMLVSVTAMPIENELGQITGSTAAIVESESLQTPEIIMPEAAAPAASQDGLTRRVFDAAASALIVIDRDGQVREANHTALRLLGRDEAAGDFADQFLAEDERIEARQTLRAALSAPAGEADPIVSRNGGADGVRWSILPLAAADGTVDVLLLAGERADSIVPAEDAAAPAVESVPATEPSAEVDTLRAEAAAARAQADEALAAAAAARQEA